MGEFIKVGDRVRYIGELKSRSDAWPEGVWLERGIEGTVTEYHPRQRAVVVRGERFEGLPAYAVVKFDNGALTCIDPEDEGKRWERIKGKQPPNPENLYWLTVNELRAMCREQGLLDSGNKEDLVQRLKRG